MNKIGREIKTGGSIKDENYKKNTLYIGLVKYLWSIIALRSIIRYKQTSTITNPYPNPNRRLP